MNETKLQECVVGVYETLAKAEQAVHILHRASYPSDQVSLVASGLRDQPEVVSELRLGDDSLHDAAVGAGLGGVLGVLAGIGALMVSGLGVVFLVGPIGGGMFGATLGAFLGSFVGWGVHEDHIRHYERRVRDGNVLVIATGDPRELVDAQRILRETDALEVNVHAKTDTEFPEVLSDDVSSGPHSKSRRGPTRAGNHSS